MKTWPDVQHRIRSEVQAWFTKQCRNPYAAFYCYYLPSSPEHDGGLLILEHPPANPEYLLASNRLRIDRTIDETCYDLGEIFFRLPVLEWTKTA